MNIRYSNLSAHLRHKLSTIYILVGQEQTLMDDSAEQILSACQQRGDVEKYRLELNTVNDWKALIDTANNYSLFSEYTYIDAQCPKKSIDNPTQTLLQSYINTMNPRCFITFRMPQINLKQLQWLNDKPEVTLVQIQPLNAKALQDWIIAQLKNRSLHYEAEIPQYIYQYNQHNTATCKQLIDILALSYPNTKITLSMLKEHLVEQSDFQLYELSEACLRADGTKICQILQQAQQKKTEPAYILGILTKEIRQLIQISHLVDQSIAFAVACQKIKIWQSRTAIYHQAMKRLSREKLYHLLEDAQKIDEWIKTNGTEQIWVEIQRFAFKFYSKTIL